MKDGMYMSSYRSEDEIDNDGVSLKAVEPLRTDAEKEMRSRIKRSTSTSYKMIDEAYTKDALVGDLQALYEYYKERFDQQLDPYFQPNCDNKADNITKLITLRRWVQDRDHAWAVETEMSVEEQLLQDDANINIASLVEDELQNPFFTLQHGSTTVDINRIHKFKRPNIEGNDNASNSSETSTMDDSDLI